MNFRLVTGAFALVLCAAASVASASSMSALESESLLAAWLVMPAQHVLPAALHSEPVQLTLFGIALSAFAFRLRRRKA